MVGIKFHNSLLLIHCVCLALLSCSKSVYTVDDQNFIDFSGYAWEIKEHLIEPAGPRDNYWASKNVCVNRKGDIELTISNEYDRWYASEVRLPKALGYGTYTFKVSTPLNDLDENAVLGLFLYANDNQEIDIEIQNHIDTNNQNNAAYTIQAIEANSAVSQALFDINDSVPITFSIQWIPDAVHFNARYQNGENISSYRELNKAKVPTDKLHVHMNYFLFEPDKGLTPCKVHSIKISDFSFTQYLN